MGNKRRGRERLESCVACGRLVPRDKAVEYTKKSVFSTDLRGSADNITTFTEMDVYYCISCAKHRKIFEKLKEQNQRRRERGAY